LKEKQPPTAPTFHFLLVNAQMHILEKQKTAQIRIPLAVISQKSPSVIENDIKTTIFETDE